MIFIEGDVLCISDIDSRIYKYDLRNYKKIFIVGAGKSSTQMALNLEKIFSTYTIQGCIVTKYGFAEKLNYLDVIEAGHPLPDGNSLKAGERISQIIKTAGKNDLILVLLSGGASSLLALPKENISLDDKIYITNKLLKKGANISELNFIRKSLSKIKGGGLSRLAYPAEVVSVILSDVLYHKLDLVGSGPTLNFVCNDELFIKILRKYHFDEDFIKSLIVKLKGSQQNDKLIKSENILIANNDSMLKSIVQEAKRLGYKPFVLKEKIVGDVRSASKKYIRSVTKIIRQHENEKKICIISGGETTVEVKGSGRGGRNLEFALLLMNDIAQIPGSLILSAGTDGDDGNSGVAGGIVHSNSRKIMHKNAINYRQLLEDNDTLSFFETLGDTVNIGHTGTNVMDVQVFLKIQKE